jgi:hypothetical protein
VKFQLIGLITSIAILTSCSKAPAPQQQALTWQGDYEEIMAIYNNQYVYCTDSSDCPGFVSKLAFNSSFNYEHKAGVCSGTLIDEEYIITNEHCIPQELNEGDSCTGKIKALFPNTDEYEKEEAECATIEKILTREDDIDIALIRLQRRVFRGQTPSVRPDMTNEGDIITAYTVDPFFGGAMGMIRKKTCKVSLQNLFSTIKSSKNKKLYMSGENCEIIGGNSGTSMLDSEGNIIGIIHSGLDLERIYKKGKDKYNFSEKLPESSISMGANISCLVAPENSCLDNKQDIQDYVMQLKELHGLDDQDDLTYRITDEFKVEIIENRVAQSSKENISTLINSFRNDFRIRLSSIIMSKIFRD